MKAKFLFAALLMAAVSFSSWAQGYKDGIEFYKIGDLANAKDLLLRNINDASTDKAAAYYYLGQIALRYGEMNEAKSYFDKGVGANANNPYNYIGQAALALKQGGNPGDLINKARKMVKKDCAVEMEIARAFYRADATKYAKDIEKCVKNATKWNPADADLNIFLGDEFTDQQRWGDAAAKYEMAFTHDPDNIEAYVKYADTYYKENPGYAIERLKEIISQVPNSALCQRELAEKYYDQNKLRESVEQYAAYLNATKNYFPKDQARYSQLLFFSGDYQKSVEVAQKLKNSLPAGDPYKRVANSLLMYGYSNLNQWDKAVETGREYFADKSGTPGASEYQVFAQSLENAGYADEAVKAYEEAIKLNPKDLSLLRGLAKSNRDAAKWDAALSYEQRVLDSPEHTYSDLYEMGNIYYFMVDSLQGDAKTQALNTARDYIAQAIAADTEQNSFTTYIYRKAQIEKEIEGNTFGGLATDSYEKFIARAEQASNRDQLASYLRRAYNYLATYYSKQKNNALSMQYYKKQLEVDPDNEALREYIQKNDK